METVIQALRTNTAEIQQAKQKVIDINESMSKSFDELENAERTGTVVGPRGVPTTVEAEKQQLSAVLAEQVANQRRAETVDYENYSNQLLADIKQQAALKDQKLAEIQAINTSSNPLEHIAGLFTIPFKAAQANDAELRAASKAQELATVNQLMQTGARTSAEIQTRVTEETNASLAEALAKDQVAVAARARITALQTNSQNISNVLNMSAQQLNNKVQEFNIGEAVDMRNLRKAQIEQMMALRDAAQKDKEASRASFEFINQALISNGKDPIPPEMEGTIVQQLNTNTPTGKLLQELYANGVKGVLSQGEFSQGATPVEAARFREQIGFTPTTATEHETLLKIESTMSNSKLVQEAKSGAERLQAMNDSVRIKLETDQTNVNASKDSLTPPVSWATMSASEALRNNKVFKEVLAPQITDNVSLQAVEPSDIFKRLGAAVRGKQVSIAEADKVLEAYAHLSIEANNQVHGLHKLTGYKQTKFMAKLPQPKVKTGMLNIGLTPNLPMNLLLDITAPQLMDVSKKFMPQDLVLVDFLNPVKRQEALARHVAGSLREPEPVTPK